MKIEKIVKKYIAEDSPIGVRSPEGSYGSKLVDLTMGPEDWNHKIDELVTKIRSEQDPGKRKALWVELTNLKLRSKPSNMDKSKEKSTFEKTPADMAAEGASDIAARRIAAEPETKDKKTQIKELSAEMQAEKDPDKWRELHKKIMSIRQTMPAADSND